MSDRTYVIALTADEMRALFTECNCCAPPEPYESANNKLYARLRRISRANGGFAQAATPKKVHPRTVPE